MREVPGAQVTLEWLLTGVDAEVNGQGSPLLEDLFAVTTCEPFITMHTLMVAQVTPTSWKEGAMQPYLSGRRAITKLISAVL
ncbi:MAG TPA: hypothetical protein ACHBX0_09175 [Arsenophonus sp.]